MTKEKIVVFGGSFNPPTIQHISIAKELAKEFDKVLFLPVSDLYSKPGMIKSSHRLEMLELISNDLDNIHVSKVEVNSKKLLVTVETLDLLQLEYPDSELYFAMGMDNLVELSMWVKYEELLSKHKILVIERDLVKNMLNGNISTMEMAIERDKKLKPYANRFIKITGIERNNISSSYVRNLIAEKGQTDCVKQCLDKRIVEYINRNKLYHCM